MDDTHQAVGDGADIAGEPAVADNFEEQIDEDGVHADDGEEFEPPARGAWSSRRLMADIDPPIAECQDEEAPTQGDDGEAAGGDAFDDGREAGIIHEIAEDE